MEDETHGSERRRDKRFDGKIYSVMFRVLDDKPSMSVGEYHSGRSLDISRSGMRFETDQPLAEGERIEYFVHSASGKSGRQGMASVCRAEQAGSICRVAVEFVAPDAAQS